MFTTLLTSTLALGTALPAEQSPDPRTLEPAALSIETPEDALRALDWPPSWQQRLDYARSQVQASADQVYTFAIPAGPLVEVVRAIDKATQLTITMDTSVLSAVNSPGVNGRFTASRALAEALAGTGFVARFTGAQSARIDVRVSGQQVDVTAPLPSLQSPKFTEPLRDTPQTVTVVSKDVIEAQAATSLRDVLRNVPGITMQAGEGGGGLPGDTLTMRGFAATSDIFVDGVRDVGPYSRDAFNLEQVEVIKGPASSVGGRGTTGGAINLATKTPTLSETRNVTLSGGNAKHQRVTADLNQPIRSGAAARLNVMWQDSGVPGRDEVTQKGWALAPSLAVGIGGQTQATLSYQHVEQDNVPDYGLPWAAFQASPAVDQSNFYGLRNYDFEDIRSRVGTANVYHQVTPAFTLRNVTRFGDVSRDSAITAPRPPNRQLQRREMTTETLANQTSGSWRPRTGRVSHHVSAGVELSRETTTNRNSAQTTNQPQTTLESPNPGDRPFGPMPVVSGNPTEAQTETASVYLFDTIDLGDWQVSGGARWDRSSVDYALTTVSTGAVTRLSREDSLASWRAGLVYKAGQRGSIYAGAGTSFNPSAEAGTTGTSLSDAPTAANSINLDPEKSVNLELGTKWELSDGRLLASAAVFRSEKTNARTRSATNEPFVLDGKQRVQGLEAGLTGQITDDWSATASFAWMDSEIVATRTPAEEGMNLAFTPKTTASLWTQYSLPFGVNLGVGAQYMDAVFRNATNTTSVPSYWLFNGLVAYQVNANLTLRVNGQNLFDKQYVDRVGGGHYIPGPRRAIVLSTGIGF